MTPFSIRQNAMRLSQLPAFLNIHGRIHNNCKDVYFLEWLGLPMSQDTLIKTLSAACNGTGDNSVICIGAHMLPSHEHVAKFASVAQSLLTGCTDFTPSVPLSLSSEQLRIGLHALLHEIPTKLTVPGMKQEQAATLLSALDTLLPRLFPDGSTVFPKCIWIGEPDLNARFLLSILPYLGCDVAVIRPTGTQSLFPQAVMLQGIPAPADAVQTLLDRLMPSSLRSDRSDPVPVCAKRQVLRIPQHPRRTSVSAQRTMPPTTQPPVPARTQTVTPTVTRASASIPSTNTTRTPLDYETLAGFASSVVMIEVLDEQGETKSSGSGVLLAPGGIILTNFHVVAGGSVYAVHLENSDAVFQTDELLKYHPNFDLALLRLPGCNGKPIPVYDGTDLVRGQSVFAIGSPLGLFNSVSDGIIAGFREFEHTKMIQFTAAAAPGSSGGALLDRYGCLIGIVTSGFTEGNINLAVSWEIIRQFAHGFLPS